jgi:hypothetical protein
MSRYVKAELALKHTIIYTDETGRYFRFSGGTWAWRNHNPGNLVPGSVSARHNQIGRAKISKTQCFAIFPDYENGHAALLDCLKTTYGEKSIDYLVAKFAPAKDGNNVKVYTKFLHDKTGVMDDKKVKDFTPDEFDKLWRAIEAMEGYQEGAITEVFPVIQVHKDKNGIYDYNVKTKGWASKEECIKLTKHGELDLIVCLSQQGHEYLRARMGSSVNGSLDKLVVKDHNKKLHQEYVSQLQIDKEKMDVVY